MGKPIGKYYPADSPPLFPMSYRFTLPEWFKVKRYPHIGKPVVNADTRKVVGYIMNPNNIIHHQFRPLIRRTVVSYPHRRKTADGSLRRKRKERPLTFASHLDANIYAYYAYRLQQRYEDFVKEQCLGEVVVAYRKIPCADGHGNKCNIHIADDVFKYAKSELEKGREVAIITFDIKGFFDNLDHRIIKRTWKQTMGYDDMPIDEYAVFRSVTQFSYVQEQALFDLFKDRILCQKAGLIVERPVKRLQYLYEHDAVSYCTTDGIKEIKRHGLLETNTDTKGIPQGLPISATLANVYMRDFDVKVNDCVKTIGGIYKRYSDDIVVVCPILYANDCKKIVMDSIKDVKLEIEERKTNLFEIRLENDGPKCYHETKGVNKPVEYLGFAFDGKRVLLKDASLCRYYNKMRIDKRRHKHWAILVNNKTNGRVFTNQIVKRFTLAGASRHHILTRQSDGSFVQSPDKAFGNYLTYAYKAAYIMGEPAIKRQLRHNLHKVKRNIAEIKDDIKRVQSAQLYAMLMSK